MSDLDNLIKVDNLYLIAALRAYGHNYDPTKIDRSNPKRVAFFFPNKSSTIFTLEDNKIQTIELSNLQQFIDAFISAIMMFPPKYLDDVQRIKKVIYESDKE